jgi:hypothetical protein
VLFIHQSYQPPMPPGRARRILTLGDQLWRTLAALGGALIIGGDIVLGAWALVQGGHPLWAMSLLGLSLLATVLTLALHYADAVKPTRKATPMHDDDQNAEDYRQWRKSRGWCGLTLGAAAAVLTLVATLVGSRPRRRHQHPTSNTADTAVQNAIDPGTRR